MAKYATVECPIDSECAAEIAALLRQPPPDEIQTYFANLLTTHQHHQLSVKPSGHHGKGVYAEKDFEPNDLVLKDQILVGFQHASNKFDCFVCSFCFRFIGSVELQIGRKLYFQNLGFSVTNDCGSSSSNGHGSSSSSKVKLPNDVVEALLNGSLKLPHSDEFKLPDVVSCPGECKEAYYCSKECAAGDWEAFHSLVCTGERSEALSVKALSEFIQHANETNDIFLLAAKVISFTILRYRKLKAAYLEERKDDNQKVKDSCYFSLLKEAWKPVAMGYKRRWWECMSLPKDIDDELTFRVQVKELAFTSLQLLKEAMFDKECKPLFSLEIYAHIIGMFEQNNLDLVVQSPMEDYFLYIDDLPQSEKEEAEQVTGPILDALGDDFSICCQGSAFFPLQSCMNHSCSPNARAFKREQDKDGQAAIIALKHIRKGEEITISYIDEDLPFEERQELLADYGFRCKCSKCSEEEL